MTVSNTSTINRLDTNGVTVDFPFTFYITEASQVKCLLVNDAGDSSEYTNFTLLKAPDNNGGTLTTGDILSGVELVIYRSTPVTQETDYVKGGRFPADSHEQALDKLTQIDQEQYEILGRAMQQPVSGGPWDAKGERIINLARAITNTDAANLGQVKDEIGKYFYDKDNIGLEPIVQTQQTATGDSGEQFDCGGTSIYQNKFYRVHVNGIYQDPSKYQIVSVGKLSFNSLLDSGDKVDVTLFAPLVIKGEAINKPPIDLAAYYGIEEGRDISPYILQAINDGYRNIAIVGDFLFSPVRIVGVDGLNISQKGKLSLNPSFVPSTSVREFFLRLEGCTNFKLSGIDVDCKETWIGGVGIYTCTNGTIHHPNVENMKTAITAPATSVHGLHLSSSVDISVYAPKATNLLGGFTDGPVEYFVRAITMDGLIDAPCIRCNIFDIVQYNCHQGVVQGYAKDCHVDGGTMGIQSRGYLGLGRNGVYVVPSDATYGGGGCTYTNIKMKFQAQPFVTSAGNVSFNNNEMVDCGILGVNHYGDSYPFDVEPTSISGNKFYVIDNDWTQTTTFLRTRAGTQRVRGLVCCDNTITTYLSYGSFLSFEVGIVDDAVVRNNTITLIMADNAQQYNRAVLWPSGDRFYFEGNTFKIDNKLGGSSRHSYVDIIMPSDATDSVWGKNDLITNGGMFYRVSGVLTGARKRVDAEQYSFTGTYLQSGGDVKHLSGFGIPRAGSWRSGDSIRNTNIVTSAALNFPHTNDDGWIVIKAGDYADPDPANWPVFASWDSSRTIRGIIADPVIVGREPGDNVGSTFVVKTDGVFRVTGTEQVTKTRFVLRDNSTLEIISNVEVADTGRTFTGVPDGTYRVDVTYLGEQHVGSGTVTVAGIVVDSTNPSETPHTPNPINFDMSTMVSVCKAADKVVMYGANVVQLEPNDGDTGYCGKLIVFNKDNACTVKARSSCYTGYTFRVVNLGTGAVTFDPNGTYGQVYGNPVLAGGGSVMTVTRVGNDWVCTTQ